MTEWSTFWTAAGVLMAVAVALGGGWKLWWELSQLRNQREKQIEQQEEEASLRRTEFFLAQHRRLFDDPNLYAVLCHLDGDDEKLAASTMWDPKRKFLAFVEEIALLVNSQKLNRETAFYMFGYYARCARYGSNFNVGIETAEAHWWVFQKFVLDYEEYTKTEPEKKKAPLTM
ncbi:hypothetical protein [Herbaspirillum sp. CAH-3]|uniref:hypothetical protein n=1 Tax=Herbaspirillum sp. CAH-3 TaxID=2605746 RepID=UPI0013938213|nr:hypothetical protein [Herbaspirillum sp. CAH-3]MRT31995.1 hypothetical protein [Herbaspirillum sp. CAH-3]